MCTACSCATGTGTETTSGASVEEVGRYTVTGMTCGHCASSVTEQIQRIDGVRDVAVDLATGAITVTADRPVPIEVVTMAVNEAGYQLT